MKSKMFFSYLILAILIIQSGFPFFTGNIWLIIFTGLTATLFFLMKKKFNKIFVQFILFFIVLMLIQIVFTGSFIIGPFGGMILKLLFAYMAIKIIGVNFMKYYVNILFYLTLFSLIMWYVLGFVPGAYEVAKNISDSVIQPFQLYNKQLRTNLIIYTNDYWLLNDYPRNAGPFWEPGGFGVYLIVAIMFNTIINKNLMEKRNIIFLFALITTFSAGSYLAFLFFIYSFIIFVKKMKPVYLVFATLLFLSSNYAYYQYNFLGKKIESRYNKMKQLDEETTYDNLDFRVGRNEQAILDLRAFYQHPIFGEGQFNEYEFGTSASGLTAFLRKW